MEGERGGRKEGQEMMPEEGQKVLMGVVEGLQRPPLQPLVLPQE